MYRNYLSSQLSLCHADIPFLVFLTKIDEYDPDVIGQDLKKTFRSERLLSLMEVSSCYVCQMLSSCSSCLMSHCDRNGPILSSPL